MHLLIEVGGSVSMLPSVRLMGIKFIKFMGMPSCQWHGKAELNNSKNT